MDVVDQTLREWRSGAFVYGQSDCMLSIGRHLAALGAKDITERFVGQYEDWAGAQEMLRAGGGVGALIAATGAVPVDSGPARGDVVELVVGDETIGALCTGDMIAVRLERGVIEIALHLAKWRGVWRYE